MKTKKQTTIKFIVSAALIAMMCDTSMFAQAGKTESQGTTSTACGCPPVASRPTASLVSKTVLVGYDYIFKPNTILGCDTIWILDKTIFVDNNNSITIKPGAVVKGIDQLSSTYFSAIVVQRGAKIFAAGTKECPIIFTSTEDALDGTYSLCNRGKWGGIVILGKAANSGHITINGNINGLSSMEGFNEYFRFYYGAGDTDFPTSDDDDNSGILRYVSIRHAGEFYAGITDDALRALALGSVGRSTTIDHVEVISSNNDAFAIFGGTVNLKYCAAMFCNDDMFNWDLGYRGKMQFLFGVQADQSNTQLADNGFEGDKGTNGNTFAFKSTPQIYNATQIGNGTGPLLSDMSGKASIRLKYGTQGLIQNCIFSNWNAGVSFTGADGSFVPGIVGEIGVHNSIFFASGTLQNPTSPSISTSNTSPVSLISFVGNGGTLNCPIGGQSTFDFPDGAKFDPIPASQHVTAVFIPPSDGFFKPVTYKGAFSTTEEPWLSGWSISAFYGIQAGLSTLAVCPTDINYDGKTDVSDLNGVKARFNLPCNKP